MKVAEVIISYGRGFGTSHSITSIGFDDLARAQAEYERLKDILKRREDRANDLEKTVTVNGINSFTCPLDEINGIGLGDFASLNEQEAGIRDAFPHLFKR